MNIRNNIYTYPAHETCCIVSVYSTLSWVSHPANITLSSEQYRMHERLRLVQVGKQEHGSRDETEENSQVIRSKVVRESHGKLFAGCRACYVDVVVEGEKGASDDEVVFDVFRWLSFCQVPSQTPDRCGLSPLMTYLAFCIFLSTLATLAARVLLPGLPFFLCQMADPTMLSKYLTR